MPRRERKGEEIMTTRYRNLDEYIRTRAADLGLNTHSLVEALNEHYESRGIEFGVSYINSIVNEQFAPSKKRCHLIAEFFGDDPNIILQLAGYYSPPEDSRLVEAVAGAVNRVPPALQHMVIGFADFVRDYFGLVHEKGLGENTACLILPSGEPIFLDVPSDISTKMLRAALNSALSDLGQT
jgi:hypothetical protein